MNIEHFFSSRRVDMTDGCVLFEVVTPDGERVGSSTNETAATDLEIALNMALTDWVYENADDNVAA